MRHKQRVRPPKVTRDRVIYCGLILIGFFACILAWLLTEHWREPLLLYLAIIAYVVNAATLAVYRGRHLPNWQQALARIPLRFVGYGTRDGKPLEAAHDHQSTRNALIVSIIASVAVIVGLAVLLIPMDAI